MFGLKDQIIEALQQALRKYPQVKRAVVFGSRARGDYRYNSDIDLAVYADTEIPAALYFDLDEAAGIYMIDIVDMAHCHNEQLRERIEIEGKPIYP